MTAFLLIGILSLLFGGLFLISPHILVKLSQLFNRVVSTDYRTLKYRVSTGLIFIALGIFFLFMAYYFYRAYIVGFPFYPGLFLSADRNNPGYPLVSLVS